MDSQEVVRSIRDAFRGIKLEDGVSLNMTEYNDSGGSAEHFRQLAADDERDDWQAIDDKTLEKFTVTFSFTDWKGFRFYLPAYMIYALTHPESTAGIGDSTIFHLDPSSISKLYGKTLDTILSKQQLKAVVQFLEYCADDSDHHDAKVANRRLRRMREYVQE
jgi:hypothetical protein